MAYKRRSFREKKRQIGDKIFVGREKELKKFKQNLEVGSSDDRFVNIVNVFGQGGVGKTTILNKYSELVKEFHYTSAIINKENGELEGIPYVMNEIALQYKRQGHRLKKFERLYKAYLQEKGKLEKSLAKPDDAVNKILKIGAKIGNDFIPMGNTLSEILPIDEATELTGEWVEFALKKLRNTDKVNLVLNPLRSLTPIWLEDIYKVANKSNISLFFDTYEAANTSFDYWLSNIFHLKYGEVPDNILLIVCGRSSLEFDTWGDLRDYTMQIPLAPFTKEEAITFFNCKGINIDKHKHDLISSSSRRLPIYLTLYTEDELAENDLAIGHEERIVDRFLKNIKDESKYEMVLGAALARKLNEDILTCIRLTNSRNYSDFKWLRQRPFLNKSGSYWVFHPIVRESIMRHQKELSESKWIDIHLKLSNWYKSKSVPFESNTKRENCFEYKNWLLLQIEKHYHQLCADYQKYLPYFVCDFVSTVRMKGGGLAKMFVDCILDAERFYEDCVWGRILENGLTATFNLKNEDMGEETMKMFKMINDK